MGQIKNIKLHIVTDIKNILVTYSSKKHYNEFPQDVHYQAQTCTQDEHEPTCATVGQDENRKQNPIQCKEETLEKNQTWTVRILTTLNIELKTLCELGN